MSNPPQNLLTVDGLPIYYGEKKFVDEYLTGKEKEVDDKIQLWKDILLKMKKKKR